nr:MAG TPA: hypothetical protein [Caudoviricetes sp.]
MATDPLLLLIGSISAVLGSSWCSVVCFRPHDLGVPQISRG